MKLYFTLSLSITVISSIQAFVPRKQETHRRTIELNVIDPQILSVGVENIANMGVVDALLLEPVASAGIAVASAAAGALSQLPRIRQLEEELARTRELVANTEAEMVMKVKALEDKLHAMDEEFEQQTVRFKKQYDQTMRQQLEEVTEKLRTDFKYKLEIRVSEEKSKLLGQQYEVVNGLTGKNQQELVELRLKQSRIQEVNKKLERTLAETQEELERMRVAAKNNKPFFFF